MRTVCVSISSQRAIGMPVWMIAIAVRTAGAIPLNQQVAAATASGRGCSSSVISAMTPSVPSLPTSSRVRSYPALLFFARVPVRTISPLARTTSSASTFSRIVP